LKSTRAATKIRRGGSIEPSRREVGMRRVIFGVANSLDNFIARRDDAVDWLLWGPEAASIMEEFWKSIDAVVMGRKTYEVAVKNGMTSYPGMGNYVVSRTLVESPDPAVTLVSGDPAEFVRALKARDGKGICLMGGGELARPLFEADLVDEIGLNIHPVLLGSGIPLFHELGRQVNLELLECRPFKNGCVFVRYGVTR
jgi:dihydrofolate reductase